MKLFRILLALTFVMATSSSFKKHQLTFKRVKEAYKNHEENVQKCLKESSIRQDGFQIYLRGFKHEEILELWAKNKSDATYIRLKTYDLCGFSGTLGPKRRQGDYQIPEGYYHIDRFNPQSSFHLSLGINYPNVSDKILGYKQNLGGDIFIHGGCSTIGCLPIHNEWIEELYVYCVEAKNYGQTQIPVHLFPFKMDLENMQTMKERYPELKSDFTFWDDIQKGYLLFEKTKSLPEITFLKNGKHQIL